MAAPVELDGLNPYQRQFLAAAVADAQHGTTTDITQDGVTVARVCPAEEG